MTEHCSTCGYRGQPRYEGVWVAWVAAVVWLVPLGFLSQGYWPFLVLPSIALTVWAVVSVRRICPVCRAPWGKQKNGD